MLKIFSSSFIFLLNLRPLVFEELSEIRILPNFLFAVLLLCLVGFLHCWSVLSIVP